MAEKASLGTRLRIFVFSIGVVALAAGVGAFYLAFYAGDTNERLANVTATTAEHGVQIDEHGRRITANEVGVLAHDKTLDQHGTRLDGHARDIGENRDAAAKADAKAAEAKSVADGASTELERLRGEAAGEREKLRGEIQRLKRELKRNTRRNTDAITKILDRLAALETAMRRRDPKRP